jgi:hypothetical protein
VEASMTMNRVFYEIIQLFELVSEKEIKRYKLLKRLSDSKYTVHVLEFYRSSDDLEKSNSYFDQNSIDSLFSNIDERGLIFYDSIEEAIEGHDKDFED